MSSEQKQDYKKLISTPCIEGTYVYQLQQAVMQLTDSIADLKAENKRSNGLLGFARNDCASYKRDSEKYLKMLESKKICPDCGTQGKVCDCPFG